MIRRDVVVYPNEARLTEFNEDIYDSVIGNSVFELSGVVELTPCSAYGAFSTTSTENEATAADS